MLAEDARFVSLGRATDPSEAEILSAEQRLRSLGLGGWLAVMEGNPYAGPLPRLMEVRCLGEPGIPFEEAAARCVNRIAADRQEA